MPTPDQILKTIRENPRVPAPSLAVEIGWTEEMASNFEEMAQGMPDLAQCFSHKPMSRQDLD